MYTFSQEEANRYFGFAYATLPEGMLEFFDFIGVLEMDIEERKASLPEYAKRRKGRTDMDDDSPSASGLSKEKEDDLGKIWATDFIVQLDERDNRSADQQGWKPNGFTERSYLRDYPIRNHRVFLELRRRRWKTPEGKSAVLDLYPLAAKGSRLTCGFADFLKGAAG